MPGMLLDSNVIIYSVAAEHRAVRDFIRRESPLASAVSRIEALGFHGLKSEERRELELFFAEAKTLPIDDEVIEQATQLRQMRRMSLGDSIIAATARVHDLTLVTRNIEDFRWVPGIRFLNPFDVSPDQPR